MVEYVIIICVAVILLIKIPEYKISIRKKTVLPKSDEVKSKNTGKRVGRVGKSMPDLRQMMTLNDSYLESDKAKEKEHTFDSSKDESEPEPKDLVIDADPTETVIDEEEDIAAYTGGEDIYTAGGMDYDVMMNTVEVINSKTASKKEEQKTGEVLHENRDTELVNKMLSTKGVLSARITSLLDLRTKQHADENSKRVELGVASNLNESEEYKNFNASDYF
ncbi:hypothetical protein [Dysgonomonas sp. ZJ709]|uniref:hypothetical protein n=1 Tax=Dysgonomonas sp. ZJ709 TaxID=2709797 RepID=UPI0013EBDBE5|nr:hypothetical protein [Dysgonomonas sp. ZJ709]